MLDGASSDDATLVPSDDEDATPHLDPGRGQRVKGARYRTHKWGDVRKWDGVQFVHDGPARQSRHDGVKWDRARRKWIGSVCDATERSRDGRNGKLLHTASFDDEDACFAALQALRAEVATRESSTLHELAQALDHTRGLPPRPADAADAQPATAYYGAAGHKAKGAATKAFRPTRYVRTSDGARGYRFIACCQHGTGPRDATTKTRAAASELGLPFAPELPWQLRPSHEPMEMRCRLGVDQNVRPCDSRRLRSTSRSSVPAKKVASATWPRRPFSLCVNTASEARVCAMSQPQPEPTTDGRRPVARHVAHSCSANSAGVRGAQKHPRGEWPERMRARAPALESRRRRSSASTATGKSATVTTGSRRSAYAATAVATKLVVSAGAHASHSAVDQAMRLSSAWECNG